MADRKRITVGEARAHARLLDKKATTQFTARLIFDLCDQLEGAAPTSGYLPETETGGPDNTVTTITLGDEADAATPDD